MKKILLFGTLSMLLFTANAQTGYLSPRISYIMGTGVQQNRFQSIGLGLQYEYFKTPGSRIGLVISGESHLAGTATKTVSLNFNNSNGYTDVDYTSSMYKLGAGGILMPLPGQFISPYVSLQGGAMLYHTKLYVNDPADNDFCKPETARNVKMSFSLVGMVESGVKVRLKNRPGSQLYAQAGVGYTTGTRASYIKLGDEPNDENTSSYVSRFKMSNGETHQHAIGTMYRTRTSQLAFHLGVSFVFN